MCRSIAARYESAKTGSIAKKTLNGNPRRFSIGFPAGFVVFSGAIVQNLSRRANSREATLPQLPIGSEPHRLPRKDCKTQTRRRQNRNKSVNGRLTNLVLAKCAETRQDRRAAVLIGFFKSSLYNIRWQPGS